MKKWTLPLIALLSIAALSASALPPPEKGDMTLSELEQNLFDLDGKIVEVEVTRAYGLEQSSAGKYKVYCSYEDGGSYSGNGATFYFSKNEDAIEFFQDLVKKGYGSGKTSFFVQVNGETYTAVGKKFKKSKGIYTW